MMVGQQSFLLSVVTPAYNEAENLPLLYERLCAVLGEAGVDWEWIVVDDHSRDNTPQVLRELSSTGCPFARVPFLTQFRLAHGPALRL